MSDIRMGINHLLTELVTEGEMLHTQRWQGVDISNNPAAQMYEILHSRLVFDMPTEDLDHYRQEIKPNLPWADDHFEERVCGEPLNPGIEHANWPYAFKGKESMKQGQYNHNYMERLWPRYAGLTPGGSLNGYAEAASYPTSAYIRNVKTNEKLKPHRGIRHEYGDLGNLVELLAKEPDTRQAYIPMFFPEDTGNVHDGRKPCSLGWHFIMRNNKLDVVYYIRSCDALRHFRDDVYMTVRLTLWILNQLKPYYTAWEEVTPGTFLMYITSLHCFKGDKNAILKGMEG